MTPHMLPEMYINRVAVIAPGIDDWSQFKSAIEGRRSLDLDKSVDPQPQILTAAVRRRASAHIRLAVAVADQATQDFEATELAAIFASSENDGATTDEICMSLMDSNPWISPTRFHNSVNNAAAGSWSIARSSRAFTSSILSYDGPAAAGLVEAQGLLTGENQVLLVIHDCLAPPRLRHLRPGLRSFACALVLSEEKSASSMATLNIQPVSDSQALSHMPETSWESLRAANPSATILPLLLALAKSETAEVCMPYVEACNLSVRVQAC